MKPIFYELNELLNFKQELLATIDTTLYGTGCSKHTNRSIYNPLFWLLGKEKVRRINPDKLYLSN